MNRSHTEQGTCSKIEPRRKLAIATGTLRGPGKLPKVLASFQAHLVPGIPDVVPTGRGWRRGDAALAP